MTGLKTIKAEKIEQILKNGSFDDFIGCRENCALEAKQKKPYDFSNLIKEEKVHAIAELVSDIAQFANGDGGYIVCGLVTDKPQSGGPHDAVRRLDLLGKKEFYAQQEINGYLKPNVYPKLKVKVDWYPYVKDSRKGLGVIHVPKQNHDQKQFIVRICELGEGLVLKRKYFGIPIRIDDYPKWLEAQEVYKLTKNTPKNLRDIHDSLSEQIQGISKRLGKLEQRKLVSKKDMLFLKIKETLNGK